MIPDKPTPPAPPRRRHRFTSATGKAARAQRERLRLTQGNPPDNAGATRAKDLSLIKRQARRALRNGGLSPRRVAELSRAWLQADKLERQEGPWGEGKPTATPSAAPAAAPEEPAAEPERTGALSRIVAEVAATCGQEPTWGQRVKAFTTVRRAHPLPADLNDHAEAYRQALYEAMGHREAPPPTDAEPASAPEPASDPAARWNQWDRETWIDAHGRPWHRVCLSVARVPPGSRRFDPRRDTPQEGAGETCAGCGRPLREP